MTARLLVSLDYEVWFTHNDDPEAVLLPPTEAILDACEAHGARATLFVDVLGMVAARNAGQGGFVDAVEDQLRRAVARGHDAQLHLHPHWLEARFEAGAWRFPADAYRLAAPGLDEAAVAQRTEALAGQGIAWLRAALRDAAYQVVAFRAGGYAIQPHDGAILQGLARAGIGIDSSVVPGMRKATGRQAVDFSAAPRLANWRVAPATGVLAPAAAGLLEIPVAAADLGPKAGLAQARFFRQPKGALIGGEGHSRDAADASAQRGRLAGRLLRSMDYGLRGWTPLILPLPAPLLLQAADSWLRQHAGAADMRFSALLHPKGFTRNALAALSDFLAGMAPRVGFETFLHAARATGPEPTLLQSAAASC